MPRPALRTRSRKRRLRPTPGGSSKLLHKAEKTSPQKCAKCGRKLAFLPSSSSKIRKLPRSRRRVSRIYGGHLCHTCVRSLLKQASRTL